MGFSINHTVWFLFDDEDDGNSFAESLPKKLPGADEFAEEGVPIWWKSYCDGRVVRIWSGMYGLMDICALVLPESLRHVIQRVEDTKYELVAARSYVESFEPSDFDGNGPYLGPDDKEHLSVVLNEMKYMPQFPDDEPGDAVLDAWTSWYEGVRLGLLRFAVTDKMDGESWPGDYAELTEELKWEDMTEGRNI